MSSKKLAILRNIPIPAPTAEPADWAKAENATGVVPLERLGAGTPDSAKFLRGDNQWAAPPPPAVREPYSARETLGILAGDGFLHVPAQNVRPFKYFMEHEIPAGSLKANSKLLMFLQLTAVSTTANTYYSILLWLRQSIDDGATWTPASGGFGSFFSSLGTEYETQTIPAIVDPPDNSSTAIKYKIRYCHYINQQASKIADAMLHVVEI